MQTIIPQGIYFVTGIDTDAGKSIATGVLARRIAEQGLSVITQKFIQTGCTDSSEDIETHRRIMGIELQPRDIDHTTAPVIFLFPSSPHLAAKLEGKTVDTTPITQATQRLAAEYDVVLIEGAGGMMVPLDEQLTTADYVQQHQIPVMLVTSPRLGSINHTLLTLEVCRNRGIEVRYLIFNHYPITDTTIAEETLQYLIRYMAHHHPQANIIEIPYIRGL